MAPDRPDTDSKSVDEASFSPPIPIRELDRSMRYQILTTGPTRVLIIHVHLGSMIELRLFSEE